MTHKILVFDSGVGGLSIANEITKLLPSVEIIYGCDNLNFPYGERQKAEIIQAVHAAINKILKKVTPNAIIIACNTASTIVLPSLRKELDIPIIGVVPAIKPAQVLSQSKIIGLLATHSTVNGHYVDDLITRYAQDCKVIRLGSYELVELAERKLRKQKIDGEQVKEILAAMFGQGDGDTRLDVIVLGCTHFPLLKQELLAATPWPITFIDSGAAIANRVREVLKIKDLAQGKMSKGSFVAYFTKATDDLKKLEAGLLEYGFSRIEIL